MNNRFVRIAVTVISFFFLTGFIPVITILGPGITAVTSGNIYKASAQFLIDQKIKKETGKNSFALVKQEIDKKNQQNKFNEDLRELVEKRINIKKKKLNFNNIIQ